MTIKDTFDIVKTRVFKKKLRTSLAILGITVGVMSVTSVTTVGTSGEEAVFKEVNKLGLDGINIKKQLSKIKDPVCLSEECVDELKSELKNADVSGVYANMGTVKCNDKTRDCRTLLINGDFYKIADFNVVSGRFISNSDSKNESMICVIDTYAQKEMFGKKSPLGKKLYLSSRLGEFELTICGVVESSSDVISDSMPISIYMPLSMTKKIYATQELDYICIYPENEKDTEKTAVSALKIIEKQTEKKDLFYIDDANTQKKAIKNVTDMVKRVLGAIGLVSIIVGGIGIMNIMLVNVSERTKEIGIKKSIGAKNKDILLEFLAEAVILTTIAGILGIGGGLAVSYLMSESIDIDICIKSGDIIKVLCVSMLSGIIFGGYPALVASNINVVDCLKND